MQNIKKSFPSFLIRLALIAILLVVAISLTPPQVALAADISVDTFVDDFGTDLGSCSLREAIQAASTNAAFGGCTSGAVGSDTILLQAGVYNLSIAVTPPLDDNSNGDLDILGGSTVIINGAGPDSSDTIIQAGASTDAGIDRVFHVLSSGNLTLNNVTVRHGNHTVSTSNGGGGIYNSGTLTINESTISDNRTTVEGGGGITSNGTLTINNSTINNNQVTLNNRDGGGLAILASTVNNLSNVTISGNSATRNGGGMFVSGSTVTLNYATIVDNTAANNGVYSNNSTVTFGSSIVAINSGTNCVVNGTGGTASTGYNLEDTNTCSFGATGDIVNSSAIDLDVLGDNLGPTHTHALQNTSDAVDAIPNGSGGCSAGVSTDQRGAVRAGGSTNYGGTACDIGAFEYDSVFDPTAITLVSFEERSSLSGMLMLAGVAFLLLASGWLFLRRQKS